MRTAPVVVIGPGSVGCGVVASTLQDAGLPYALVARTRFAARRLARTPPRVRHVGPGGGRTQVLRPADVVAVDDSRLRSLVAAAPMVVVAVGSGQAPALAPSLARALARRAAPVPVLVCDNRPSAARTLRALVGEHTVAPLAPHPFAGVLVDRIAHRSGPGPDDVVVEAAGGLLVDRRALGGAEVRGLTAVDDLTAHLTRKKFVFSAGHAAAAYLGGLGGHATLPAALEDPGVSALVREVVREGRAGVAALFGADVDATGDDLEHVVQRFACPELADPVARVGRDPRRKLARGDRICGPALAALGGGTVPVALAVTAAAALTWGATLDASLDAVVRTRGAGDALARLTGLDRDHRFVELTDRAHHVLAAGGTALEALDRTRTVAGDVRR